MRHTTHPWIYTLICVGLLVLWTAFAVMLEIALWAKVALISSGSIILAITRERLLGEERRFVPKERGSRLRPLLARRSRSASQSIHVFLDTSTLENLKYDLSWPALHRVVTSPFVALHTTSISNHEIAARIEKNVAKSRHQMREAEGWTETRARRTNEWKDSRRFLESYLTHCTYTHSGRGVDLAELTSRFTECVAPFSKKKPEEFKDAISALALHLWAKTESQRIYIISDDGDWEAACNAFDFFELESLGKINRILAELDTSDDMPEFDIRRVEETLAESEDQLAAAADEVLPVIPGYYNVILEEIISISEISVDVKKQRIDGWELIIEVVFSASAELTLVDRRNRTRVVASKIAGALEARIGASYSLRSIVVTRWEILELDSNSGRRASNDDS